MRWIDRLNMAQRVVVVITLGLALGIVASYLTGYFTGLGVRTGLGSSRAQLHAAQRAS